MSNAAIVTLDPESDRCYHNYDGMMECYFNNNEVAVCDIDEYEGYVKIYDQNSINYFDGRIEYRYWSIIVEDIISITWATDKFLRRLLNLHGNPNKFIIYGKKLFMLKVATNDIFYIPLVRNKEKHLKANFGRRILVTEQSLGAYHYNEIREQLYRS